MLSGPAHPALLSHLAHAFREQEARLEPIALNPAADDATIAFLAGLPFKRVVDIVSNNQERMIRAPEIVEALGSNPLTGRAVIDRILSFLGVAGSRARTRSGIRRRSARATPRPPCAPCSGTSSAASRAAWSRRREGEAGESDSANLYALIQKMTVFQKIKLARLGNKEARGLLVKDRNKVVAIAAISSPKITTNEVIAIAQSRNVHDEVLRMVSMNRLWTRAYRVKLALATNPKCPQVMAMKFVNYLQDAGPEGDHEEQGRTHRGVDPRTPHADEEGKDLMAKVSSRDAQVNARIVYWGVEGAGKTANLHAAYAKLRPDHRGELRVVPTRLDPSVSYEVLPIELGDIAGVRTQIELIAVPGPAEQAPTRKQLLDQVDGVVFVVDSQPERVDANIASFEELRRALRAYGRQIEDVPLVVQYNKRDLADPYALEDLHRKLDVKGAVVFEAVATDGTGVLQTLSTISKRVIRSLREQGAGASARRPRRARAAADAARGRARPGDAGGERRHAHGARDPRGGRAPRARRDRRRRPRDRDAARRPRLGAGRTDARSRGARLARPPARRERRAAPARPAMAACASSWCSRTRTGRRSAAVLTLRLDPLVEDRRG